MERIFKQRAYWCFILLAVCDFHKEGTNAGFTYFEEDSAIGQGLKNWGSCPTSAAYFPWAKFLNDQYGNDCADMRSSSSRHLQSPIDIYGWGQCQNADNDDNHRHWTNHGDCDINDVIFEIKPWGLLMTWPMPYSNQNPETSPCKKPIMDSSGGYGESFYANYISVVSPSEHTIKGVRFDAEINIAHFNYGTNIPMIFSILARADSSYPDNPNLEPYLREWDRIHARNRERCEPALQHCPTTAKQLVTGYLDSSKTTGESMDGKGIMFDLKAGSSYDVAIKGFDINVRNQDSSAHRFKVYVRKVGSSGGTHIGYEQNSSAWTLICQDVYVYGMGAHAPSRLTLDLPYLLRRGETLGFYLHHINDNDLYNANVNGLQKGSLLKSDGTLSVIVGSAMGLSSGSSAEFTDVQANRGFSGNVYYAICDGNGSNYYIINPYDKSGLELASSIEQLSGNGFTYIGCFQTGGNGMIYQAASLSSSQCAQKCRDVGIPFSVRRDGGICYCTHEEYAGNGHADKCSCRESDMYVGSNKQCVYRVMPQYKGCFGNSSSEDAFSVRISGITGLELVKCEEVCRDAGYRYMGRQWQGICYCSNNDNYGRYGTRSGCSCEEENVGSMKFCAYDLGNNIPSPQILNRSANYNSMSRVYKGCFIDTGDRALPIYVGANLSDNECAQRCFSRNHKYFGLQWTGQCYCGDGDYSRHGSSSICTCNKNNKGAWILCIYEFVPDVRRRDLLEVDVPKIDSEMAEIQPDGSLRVTAKKNENFRAAQDARFASFAQTREVNGTISTAVNQLKCNDAKELYSNSDQEVIVAKGVMFDIQLNSPLGEVVVINGFDLYLSIANLESVGAMRNLRVFTRPKSQDGSGEWSDLGTYHVIASGTDVPVSLDFQDPVYLFHHGVSQTFVIRDTEQQADIINSVVRGKHIGDAKESDDYINILINPESQSQRTDETSVKTHSFHGVVHYSVCRDPQIATHSAPLQQARMLDHGYRDMDWGPFIWTVYPEFDPYRLLTTPWFYRYSGSYTKPLCYDDVRWRIFKEPLQISVRQKNIIDELIKEMIDPSTCKKSTVGKPRQDGTDRVNVNRPLQTTTSKHQIYVCDANYWGSQGFYNTPRGNTNWKLLKDKGLFVDPSHWVDP